MLLRLAAYGADGIEAFYTTHTERETEYFGRWRRTGLLVTGGSDTHIEDGAFDRLPAFYPSEALLGRSECKFFGDLSPAPPWNFPVIERGRL